MRKAKPRKRIILPDPKFNDVLVTKFVNNIMLKGKKTIAYNIFYEAIDIVSQRSNENGLDVWKKALANVTPNVEVRSRRIGGATFQIPSEIRPERKQSMGMKNLIGFARKRNLLLPGQGLGKHLGAVDVVVPAPPEASGQPNPKIHHT